MNGVATEIVLIAILILVNGFFAGAEAALIAVRRTQVNELALRSGAPGRILKKLKEAPDRFLATVQVGVTLVGTLASVVSGATVVQALTPVIADLPVTFAQRWPQQIAIALVVGIIAFASLVIGELVPKYLALARPGPFALSVARPIHWLSKVGHPLVILLTSVSRFITRLLGVRVDENNLAVSDQEIRHLVLEGRLHGSIHPTEHDMIHQVLDFSDTIARQVMTPRPDVMGLDLKWELEKTLSVIREEGYSRFPVYDQSIDNIRGIVYTKDIIHLLIEGTPIILRDLIHPAMFVPDSMPIAQALARFKAEKTHMAIVLDEFGGTAGVLTLEDVIEEIVGEIQDEYDTETEGFRLLPDGTALAAGNLSVIDFNERFGVALPTDRADTLAGLINATLDRVPKLGDHVELDGVRLEVASREKRRTRLLRARRVEVIENED
ncbi:MAG: hemolysin family protein [Candidatus Zixiibacteriota bacterium]